MHRRNLMLIGFMGVGKSTIGRLCANRLNLAFRDSDAEIEARANMPIPRIFATQGEAAFRALERQVIADLCATPGLVLATGGGVVLDPRNVACLREAGLVVLLSADIETILRRVGSARRRPLLAQSTDPRARIEALLAGRAELYRAAAHCRVETGDWPAAEVAERVVSLYETIVGD